MNEIPSETAVAAWIAFVRFGQTVLAAVEQDLKAAGFPPLAWYDVLLELDRAPQGALRPFELEARLLLQQYNLSRLVARIERDGYVVREPAADDGRGHRLRITAEGRALRAAMWPAYAAAIERRFASRLPDGADARLLEICRSLMPRSDRCG